MKIAVTLFVFFTLTTSSFAQSKSIDMSAMDHVWNIIAKLEKDIKPSEEEWKAMFATPGYKALGDWNNNTIRENFELVFPPTMKEKLAKALQTTNYWWKRDLNHLIKVKEQKDALKKYQKEIDVDNILHQAMQRAEVYLTKGISQKNPPPPIQFVIFSPDARSMGGNIIFDLKYTMDLPEDEFIKIMAHEAHHHYTNFMKKEFNWPDEQSSYDPIVSTLSQLKTEGIADLIDKPYPPVIKRNDTAGYLLWTNAQKLQTPKMKTLDSMLCKMSDDTTGMYQMGMTAFKMFPGNCHPNGQYMAVLIKKHIGIPALIKSATNPFLFFRQYRQACIKEKTEYVLSDKAMAYIDKLEKMFAVKVK